MESRPKIKADLTTLDRLIEVAGWLALSLIWIITLFYYRNLPETIPTHFNAAGVADDFGPKITLFLLPSIGTILFIGMTILNRYPHVFNYPVKITPENALKQYTMATRLVRVLKLAVLVIFTTITWMTSFSAINQTGELGIWFLPGMMVIIFVPLGYYLVHAFRNH